MVEHEPPLIIFPATPLRAELFKYNIGNGRRCGRKMMLPNGKSP